MTVKETILGLDYVSEARKVMQRMQKKGFKASFSKRRDRHTKDDELTSTQIRNLLALTSALYNMVMDQGVESEVVAEHLTSLRIYLVYQSGRNAAIAELVEEAKLLDILEEIQTPHGAASLRSKILRLCKYMEALVAYHKYYGGKD